MLLDPISLEIVWGRLQSIVDEAALRMVKSSFSSIIREGKDYCIMLLNRNGDSIVQSSGSIPAFLGTMPRTMKAMLAKYPSDTWSEGDVVCTNDPWLGAGHLQDVNIAVPIINGGSLIGFVGVIAHMADIGGRGFVPDSKELYEEGLRLPILQLRRRGQRNTDIYDIIRENVRLSTQVLGDIDGMMAAADYVTRRVLGLVASAGVDLDITSAQIHNLCETAMRSAIRMLPEGVYRNEIQVEAGEEDLTICVACHIEHDTIRIDYSGSSPQTFARAINCALGYTFSYSAYAVKCLLAPEVPINDGTFRPLSVTAPPQSIVNCAAPAPVTARNLVGHYLPAAVYGALASVVPNRVVAECGSPRPMISLNGSHADGSRFSTTLFLHGGMGASASSDGLPCIAFPTNSAAAPTEIIELTTPVLVEEKELLADSGGAGLHRGGLGQRIAVRSRSELPISASILGQRVRHRAGGLFGGQSGRATSAHLNGESEPRLFVQLQLKNGDIMEVCSPGGGGYGNPAEREAGAIKSDLAGGYTSDE